jgi:hypothetical protein
MIKYLMTYIQISNEIYRPNQIETNLPSINLIKSNLIT